MNLNDFYKVVEISDTEQGMRCSVRLFAQHPVYEGHFPGHPVMPGVAQLEILKELVEKKLARPLFLRHLSQLKFLAIVNPNENNELVYHIHIEQHSDGFKIKNKTTFANGKAVLKCNLIFTTK